MVAPLPFGQKTRRTGATGHRLARWQSSGALPTIVQSMEALQSLVSWDRSNQRYDDAPAAEGVMRYFMASYPCRGSHAANGTGQPHG
jgi:hypothetical protein